MAAKAQLELVIKLNNKASGEMKKFQKGINANKTAIRNTGLALVGMGAAAGLALGSAVKSAASFEKGMTEVNTLVNLSKDDIKALSDETLALSGAMGIDAVEATKALYQTISASVPPAEAIGFLETAMRAAIGYDGHQRVRDGCERSRACRRRNVHDGQAW